MSKVEGAPRTSTVRKAAFNLLLDETTTFLQTMSALKSLKEATSAHIETLDANPAWAGAVRHHQEQLPAAKQNAFRATIRAASPILTAVAAGLARASTTSRQGTSSDPSEKEVSPRDMIPQEMREVFLEIEGELPGETEPADMKVIQNSDGSFSMAIEDPEIAYHFAAVVRKMAEGAKTPSHRSLLMRSILTMAVGSFEVLVGNLFRSHLMQNPGSLARADLKSFSLEDLYGFSTIQDAVDETIFAEADAFSRKGVRPWQSWFSGNPLKIDLGDFVPNWDEVVEVFERRNIVIHNGSRVTRQYIANAPKGAQSVKEGQRLDVSPEYLDRTLSLLTMLGLLLSVRIRLKIFKQEEIGKVADWVSDQHFALLDRGEFDTVIQMTSCLSNLPFPQSDLALLKINGWVAKRNQEPDGPWLREVENWDTSAMHERFRVAQLVLLGRHEEALPGIRAMVEQSVFSVANLSNWPLFRWMRDEGALEPLLSELSQHTTQSLHLEVASGGVTGEESQAARHLDD